VGFVPPDEKRLKSEISHANFASVSVDARLSTSRVRRVPDVESFDAPTVIRYESRFGLLGIWIFYAIVSTKNYPRGANDMLGGTVQLEDLAMCVYRSIRSHESHVTNCTLQT
jgi:hypothetical protein